MFDAHCVSCDREGGTAPVLAGERFTKSFADATLLAVVYDDPDHHAAQRARLVNNQEYVEWSPIARSEWLRGPDD